MQVATWNMYRYNKRSLQGVQTLLDAGHDVVCLQEVPEHLLDSITKLTPHHAVCRELVWKKGTQKTFLVTLSQHPLTHTMITPHKRWPSFATKILGLEEGLEFHAVDVRVHNHDWRIFNVHLPLHAPPFGRMIEWIRICSKFSQQSHNVICADFNAYAGPIWSALLSPILGTKFKHLVAHERKRLKKFLEKKNLQNPFGHWRTQVYFPYQLDFILHHETLTPTKAKRWPSRLHSDHWPLSITLEQA